LLNALETNLLSTADPCLYFARPKGSDKGAEEIHNRCLDAPTTRCLLHHVCSVFGPTCDALDTISLAEQLPDMDPGEYVYSENIGAYSAASSTSFNGFPPAMVVHVNQERCQNSEMVDLRSRIAPASKS